MNLFPVEEPLSYQESGYLQQCLVEGDRTGLRKSLTHYSDMALKLKLIGKEPTPSRKVYFDSLRGALFGLMSYTDSVTKQEVWSEPNPEVDEEIEFSTIQCFKVGLPQNRVVSLSSKMMLSPAELGESSLRELRRKYLGYHILTGIAGTERQICENLIETNNGILMIFSRSKAPFGIKREGPSFFSTSGSPEEGHLSARATSGII